MVTTISITCILTEIFATKEQGMNNRNTGKVLTSLSQRKVMLQKSTKDFEESNLMVTEQPVMLTVMLAFPETSSTIPQKLLKKHQT